MEKYTHDESCRQKIDNLINPNSLIILVGNKSDLKPIDNLYTEHHNRLKSYLVEKYPRILPLECSARSGHNINKLFTEVVFRHLLTIQAKHHLHQVDHNTPVATSFSQLVSTGGESSYRDKLEFRNGMQWFSLLLRHSCCCIMDK